MNTCTKGKLCWQKNASFTHLDGMSSMQNMFLEDINNFHTTQQMQPVRLQWCVMMHEHMHKGGRLFGKKCNFHTPEWHESQRIIIVMEATWYEKRYKGVVGFHNQFQGLIFISQAIHSIHTCCTVSKISCKTPQNYNCDEGIWCEKEI